MGSNKYSKPLIIRLRKKGKTYSEIRNIYNVPKGTLSSWLKDIEIPKKKKEEMQKRAYEKWKKGNEIFINSVIEKASRRRTADQNKAKREIRKISSNELKLIGSALYWAEGNKKYRNQLRFSNSDPKIIKIIMKFFRETCNINNQKIKGRIHIYPGMDYNKIVNFWAKLTKLPKINFYKPQTQISKASKRKRNTLPYGTLHLNAGDTECMSKIKGWISGIANKI